MLCTYKLKAISHKNGILKSDTHFAEYSIKTYYKNNPSKYFYFKHLQKYDVNTLSFHHFSLIFNLYLNHFI